MIILSIEMDSSTRNSFLIESGGMGMRGELVMGYFERKRLVIEIIAGEVDSFR